MVHRLGGIFGESINLQLSRRRGALKNDAAKKGDGEAATQEDSKLIAYSREELDALCNVIDYAEKMIFREQQIHPYAALRRHAYGKTVIVDTEKRGQQSFRLSQTSAVITPNMCGYATPHSPVGRLCSYLRPGDNGESDLWGEWSVKEIRLFERFSGAHFEENIRNFSKMEVSGASISKFVLDLAAYIRQPTRRNSQISPFADDELPKILLETIAFTVAEDELEETLDLADIDDGDDEPDVDRGAVYTYFGLSETFYVNQTLEQNSIIARSPLGPMFVEGVAGSGKTSAALGRTKMLCDFDASNVASEAEFREILGPDAAYWDGKFAGQFSQESSVGFVRTGELIQYLKETCRRIDLPNLPVIEYRELQTRLRDLRGLAGSGSVRGWSGTETSRSSNSDTTMSWLRAADMVAAKVLAARLRKIVPDRNELLRNFQDKYQAIAGRIADKALSFLSVALDELAMELEREEGADFRLDRIVVRLHECLAKLRKELMGKDVLWLFLNDKTFAGSNEIDLARQIIDSLAVLYDKRGARFVWIDQHGVVDRSISLITSEGKAVSWSESVIERLNLGDVVVRENQDRIVRGVATNLDDLYFRLLAKSSEKVYSNREGVLVAHRIERGLGRAMLPLKTPEDENDGDVTDAVAGAKRAVGATTVRKRSIDSRLAPLLPRRVLAPLRDMGSLYLEGLESYREIFSDSVLADEIIAGLRSRKLTGSDIDLLLCMFQISCRSFRGQAAQLSNSPFYQSVFIDEVQDFTEQQIFLMAEQARPEYRAVTVVGDLAQKLHNGTGVDIAACFPRGMLNYTRLTENIRQAGAPGLALFSACFREVVQRDGAVDDRVASNAIHARRWGVEPILRSCQESQELDRHILEELANLPNGHTAVVIFPNAVDADVVFKRLRSRLEERMISAEVSSQVDLSKRFVRHFATVENTKGLEFDVVLIPMLDSYDLLCDRDKNRLYVGITRARRRLVLLAESAQLHPSLQMVFSRYRNFLDRRN